MVFLCIYTGYGSFAFTGHLWGLKISKIRLEKGDAKHFKKGKEYLVHIKDAWVDCTVLRGKLTNLREITNE